MISASKFVLNTWFGLNVLLYDLITTFFFVDAHLIMVSVISQKN